MTLKKFLRWGGWIIPLFLMLFFYFEGNSSPPITELAKIPERNRNSLSAKVIPETDLPPDNTRSLFDHIIAQNGGLPYPYEKLVDLIASLDRETSPISLLIPNGRSLLKGQADNAHPRIVSAADSDSQTTEFSLGAALRGRLFLGFVENASEIEVLSYNEGAGRFEFQLVQNYCNGCVPKIVYARRAICTTCHQGATPIFSQRPWNETNGQPETSQAIRDARKDNNPYHEVSIQKPLSHSERYDQLTDIGNFFIGTQRLWLDGCGEKGNDCRREMLAQAFQYLDNAGNYLTNTKETEKLRSLQRKYFPEPTEAGYKDLGGLSPMALTGSTQVSLAGIFIPESDLFNRDPIGEKQGFKGWLRSLFTREIRFGEGAKDNEDLSEFEKLPPLRRELDPLTPRPPKKVVTAEDLDAAYGIASFFTDSDYRLLYKKYGFNTGAIVAKIQSLEPSFFDPKPFSRVSVLKALLGEKMEYGYLDTSEMSPPLASGVPPLSIREFPELKLYEEHCFACHRGNPAKRLNFMAGGTEKEVLDSIKAKSEIRDALDWERYANTEKASKLMPPRDSIQYENLQKKGESMARELKSMRDLVPGLFEF